MFNNLLLMLEKLQQIRCRNVEIRDNDLCYRVCISRFRLDEIGSWLGRLMVELNSHMKTLVWEDWTQKEFTGFS